MNAQNVMRQSARKNKYKAVKVVVNGIKFDSKKEAKRYQELVLLQKTHYIRDLKLQVPFVLIEKSKYGRQIKYVADFTYIENGVLVVEDTKGFKTDVYKLKKRLMAEKYGIEIKES